MVDNTGGAVRLDGDRSVTARRLSWLLAFLLFASVIAGLATGAAGTSLWQAMADLVNGRSLALRDRVVLWEIRAPRVLMGCLVGAALAVSGAALQGLFRNPLADPGIVGVSAGASLGAVSAIVLGGALAFNAGFAAWLVPISAFIGAWVTTILLYRIATRRGRTSVATMLLAGIALTAMAMSLTGILVYMADDAQLRDFTFWSMGSLAGSNWSKMAVAAPIIVFPLLLTPLLATGLNGLSLGEAAAGHIGIRVQQLKAGAVLIVAASTGAAVAVSGGIGFVGIVVPHLLRLVSGPDHRYLIVNSALLGATLLVSADLISRVIIAPSELPIGIITAVIGAPFFLWILLRQRGVVDL
ncbi:iron complex transport system permease protein [Ruegeria halocynthiae]|uniref:Iron complex transport system permease protein n=1 Tax=Ruegeria halocynthiae TaxID=985054 RepID=A0A1H2XWJ4_9RHOB|nr:iron ABC transporter permease [Ruegeria halocynthiae]SDW97170.1 iron complex transport system permease protein [Ruegeria halocynthiae]